MVVKHSAFLHYKKPEKTDKMRDEFSKKRLLSVFRYCFGNVSGLFRDCFGISVPSTSQNSVR